MSGPFKQRTIVGVLLVTLAAAWTASAVGQPADKTGEPTVTETSASEAAANSDVAEKDVVWPLKAPISSTRFAPMARASASMKRFS